MEIHKGGVSPRPALMYEQVLYKVLIIEFYFRTWKWNYFIIVSCISESDLFLSLTF